MLSQGFKVEAIDLAGAGADSRRVPEEVSTFAEYNQPLTKLIEASPDGEKLILVGHSFGGLSLGLAMEAYPEKIAAGVFVTANMPDTTHSPSHILEQVQKALETFENIEMKTLEVPGRTEPLITILFGPNVLATNLYQNCTTEIKTKKKSISEQDLTLATLLVRPTALFLAELSKKPALTKERYGSVDKFYILCDEDKAIPADLQQLMIKNNPVKEVMQIKGADHMPMLSKSQELCNFLAKIINYYD
ncbi:Salicylic acid-binding protein 2 [Apostasia shenzhenica]|uniref:Salicylic acid-binding protein 2 n=1 Tax=Apostasia shenzhenica TaxID=1088818 RepID=A0A2I0AKU1_9ASPA|nr:Salicylic acid-binding protein 2 [Apostasia shenzhenica]